MVSKLKKIPEYLQGKYVAEDDFWKITNYFVELNRRDAAYRTAGIKKPIDELKKEAADIVKNTVPNYATLLETLLELPGFYQLVTSCRFHQR